MALRQYSYRDIPRHIRAQRAAEAMRQVQATLSDPSASPEKKEAAQRQREYLRQWAAGTLPDAPEAMPAEDPEPEMVALAAPMAQADPEPESQPRQDFTVEVHEELEARETLP